MAAALAREEYTENSGQTSNDVLAPGIASSRDTASSARASSRSATPRSSNHPSVSRSRTHRSASATADSGVLIAPPPARGSTSTRRPPHRHHTAGRNPHREFIEEVRDEPTHKTPTRHAPTRHAPARPVPTDPATQSSRHRNAPVTENDFDTDEEHLVEARRRTRRAHRHRTVSLPAVCVSIVLLVQLTLLLYVQGLRLAAVHRADKLEERIAQVHDEIKQSQRKISILTSTPQLEVWSKQLGLRRVQQSDIDRISETARPYDMAAEQPVLETPVAEGAPASVSAEVTKTEKSAEVKLHE